MIIMNPKITRSAPLALAALLTLVAQVHSQTPAQGRQAPPPPPPPPPPAAPAFGGPIPGLTPAQIAAFSEGLDEFRTVETVASGLGPIYNNVSCVACHANPVPGGSSALMVTRFGRTTNGVFDPLTALGGSLLQEFAIDPRCQEVIPPQANTIAHRQTTPLYGMGLIEAIPDSVIQALASRPSVDGVTGHAAHVQESAGQPVRVGRFGWKAQHADLLFFAGDAYLNEMGITNRLFPTENAPNGNQALLAQFDTFADPEDAVDPATGKSDIDRQTDFMRMLAPPPALPQSASAVAGGKVFQNAGCAVCHVRSMNTGPSPIAALSNKTVTLWSDLLLHDMSSLGDGIAQGDASPTEMRTAPLWGLRAISPYLHDGRAPNLDDAIRDHDGEAKTARNRYLNLSPAARQQLLDFLNTL